MLELAIATRFYERALGLTPVFVSEEYGWAQMEGAAIPLALYVPGNGGGDRQPGGTVDVHLSAQNLDEHIKTAKSVATDAAIHANADGSRSLEFTDPDNNIIRIMETPAGG
ncbi:MAG: hypothetical protein AAF318_10310 [Pseudomonadota bacterium]